MTDHIYARISQDSEKSGSITKQLTRLKKVAEDGYEVYEERSVSGAKVAFADRPQGARLLAALAPGDRVLVTKIDRAARNVRDLLGIVETIEDAGASIVFVDQSIDTGGPMGRFLLTLLAAVAELEAATVAERVRETRESFRAEGRFAGGPVPFGFTTAPHPTGRGLVLRPDPDTADTARDVIARVLSGEPQRTLAPLLGLGEPGFSRWLRNPLLAGIRPGGDDLTIDADGALISLVEWRRLQEHLDRPEKAWSKAEGIAAALTCATCGERLYFAKSKKAPESSVYRCGRRKHAPGTPGVSVTATTADVHVQQAFLAAHGNDPLIEVVTVSSSDARDEAIALAQTRLDAAQRAQRQATDRQARRDAADAVEEALDALDEAEALPEETVTVERDTGSLVIDVWDALTDAEKVEHLTRDGRWVVAPGRGLDIAEKVKHAPCAP